MKSILVIFGKDIPQKSQEWWSQFDRIITPKDLNQLVSPGSVQQAYDLASKLPNLVAADGKRISKLINYKGYDLWWVHYDDMYDTFCLPYTQYSKLLEILKDFEKVYLFQPLWSDLFRYFLKARGRECVIFDNFKLRKLLPLPFGIFLQLLISLFSLPWLLIVRPRLMVWIGDKFDSPHSYDWRMKFIYRELWGRKIPFAEFIRSIEHWPIILNHTWQRRRPVFYSAALVSFIYSFTNLFGKNKEKESDDFWFLVATHYLHNIKGTIWSILAMKFILQLIGVKAAIIPAGCSRTFHGVLGCKLAGIKTVGIQHGLAPRYFLISDFMPDFDGEKQLSVDKYGLWSDWWREYYLKYSRAYNKDQLCVSGSMRPLEKESLSKINSEKKEKPRILFISEQLAAPKEAMPYLLTFLEINDFDLYLKFRPYRDGFEKWLKQERPEILKKIKEKAKILRGTMQEAVSQCDVVVGSHSTAVLESLLLLKPFVFFWTNKWGDYFDIKSFDTQGRFFAENPKELINCIKRSVDVPKEDLKQLQERFFGDPYQNGSKWVVEQALEFAKNYHYGK